MELKEYQQQSLDAFSGWLRELRQQQTQVEAAGSSLQAWPPEFVALARDYPRATWKRLRDDGQLPHADHDYVARTDGAGRPIPHICFKLPTGGGKTLLGAAALERLNQPTGLVLWFVPTRAIYAQTKSALWNREHPYRQMLERASGGRVKLLEKDDPISALDAANYLCVMLISLQGANRKKNKEFLRMFRDSGKYAGFFPDDDDLWAHSRLLREQPDLEQVDGGGLVMQSLANVFKRVRPVVVLDEAHKAYGKAEAKKDEFVRSINRFNPSLVIELTATPNRAMSNLLVDVDGPALKREEMIKLPIQVRTTSNADWRQTLALALEELDAIERDAVNHHESSGRYIRPIAVVRVERTGKEQRGGGYIHAEDARSQLELLGVPSDQIAVKSTAVDEITGIDLLSPFSPIRWIVTKAALMEGWDCPFAYMLVVLDQTKSKTAMTQLLGRVMRQPEARRSGVERLDQCYVYCAETSVSQAMQHVKQGLEEEGLQGLSADVQGETSDLQRVKIRRRERFEGMEVFLPNVLCEDDGSWVELDYQRHILRFIDWGAIRVPHAQRSQPESPRVEFGTVDLAAAGATTSAVSEEALYMDTSSQLSWFTRRLADIVPNPWQAARIAKEMLDDLTAEQSDELIYRQRTRLVEAMREAVQSAVEAQSEQIFRDGLQSGSIRFSMEATLPRHSIRTTPYEVSLPTSAHELQRSLGQPLQISLFEPIIEEQFDSELEKLFARYLDEEQALHWWHRVGVRQAGEYYVRGWKSDRIWPDFIAMAGRRRGVPHLLVFETKGEHLAESADTRYKSQVLKALQDAFNQDRTVSEDMPSYGDLTIQDGPMRGTFQIVFSQASFDVVDRALQR